jgi:hypothetical protein
MNKRNKSWSFLMHFLSKCITEKVQRSNSQRLNYNSKFKTAFTSRTRHQREGEHCPWRQRQTINRHKLYSHVLQRDIFCDHCPLSGQNKVRRFRSWLCLCLQLKPDRTYSTGSARKRLTVSYHAYMLRNIRTTTYHFSVTFVSSFHNISRLLSNLSSGRFSSSKEKILQMITILAWLVPNRGILYHRANSNRPASNPGPWITRLMFYKKDQLQGLGDESPHSIMSDPSDMHSGVPSSNPNMSND